VIHGLQDQLRACAARARRVGKWGAITAVAFVILVLLVCWRYLSVAGWKLLMLNVVLCGAGAAVLAIWLGGSLAESYAQRQVRYFRRRLADLTLEERADVLLPLQDESSEELREIIRPLMHLLCRDGHELTPPSGAEGSGEEVTGHDCPGSDSLPPRS
jgi:hypothetical protein